MSAQINSTLRLHSLRTADLYNERSKLCREETDMQSTLSFWVTFTTGYVLSVDSLQDIGSFKVIPLKLFYYQTFFETWRNKHS